jgi:DNA (cytosine-5)-methyltransferase 1
MTDAAMVMEAVTPSGQGGRADGGSGRGRGMTLTVGSLFSGVGGFDLGFERAGMETIWFCESDDFCRDVLAKHWPGVPIYDDIRTLDTGCLPRPDILAGGFPCQDLSIAGKRAGLSGQRSGLWREYLRVIRDLRPRYVVVENVTGLLVRGMGTVLGDLASCGYDAEWDCLPASAFGAPHQRERIFLIAYPSCIAGQCRILTHGSDGFPRDPQWRAAQGIATGRGWKRWLIQACATVDRQDAYPWFRDVDDGLSSPLDERRLVALGNAVVPQVAEYVARRIKAVMA